MSSDKNPARVKGGKIAAAKNLAKQTGQDQFLPEYRLVVAADGKTYDYSSGQMGQLTEEQEPAMPTADPSLLRAGGAEDLAAQLAGQAPIPGVSPAPSLAAASMPEPAAPAAGHTQAVDAANMAQSPLFREISRLQGLGLSLEEASTLAATNIEKQAKQGIEAEMKAQDTEAAGQADAALVAAYQERMKTYQPPTLEKTFMVTLRVQFASYVEQWAAWESTRRGRDVTPEDAIQMMVRNFWQNDPLRALLSATSSSGPAGAFNPTTGQWGG